MHRKKRDIISKLHDTSLKTKNTKKQHQLTEQANKMEEELQPLLLDASKLLPTPNYNMCVMEDMVITAHYNTLNKVITKHCPIARDIVILLKVNLLY